MEIYSPPLINFATLLTNINFNVVNAINQYPSNTNLINDVQNTIILKNAPSCKILAWCITTFTFGSQTHRFYGLNSICVWLTNQSPIDWHL